MIVFIPVAMIQSFGEWEQSQSVGGGPPIISLGTKRKSAELCNSKFEAIWTEGVGIEWNGTVRQTE